MAKILAVDDDPIVRSLLETVLRIEGHEVKLASDGMGALRLFRDHNFDLVITDFEMPSKNGVELTVEIKNKNPNLPVIMITGNPPTEHRADVLLAKPISSSDLIKQIDLLLKKQ